MPGSFGNVDSDRKSRGFREAASLSQCEGARSPRYPELVITVGTSLAPVHAALTQLALTLGALSVGILLVALVAAHLVCRRVLAPIDRMAVVASSIDADDLERRLPPIATNDELGKLNRVFNAPLDSLAGVI